MLKRLIYIALAIALAAPARAATVETAAGYAFLIDYDTGTVLLNKNADAPMHPSSMTKLMTSYLLDRRIREGKVQLTDTFPVSEKAWKMQGSKMFVHVGERVAVEDLIRGIVIQSGNDACVVVAEALSGTEEAFAQEMNRVGTEIGLTGSHFVNATGWPDDAHVMTARDLATLSTRIITEFPENYHFYSEQSFTYNNITQANRNRLLGNDIGVDGLKTGHTDVAGYGITLSAKDPASGRRLILVINGLPTDNARMEEGDRLLRWGFREFSNHTVLKAGEVLEHAKVWFGASESVPLTSAKDIIITLPAGSTDEVKFSVRYTGPIPAPVAKDAHVADLIVIAPGQEEQTLPLIAAQDVPALSGLSKAWANLRYMLLGHFSFPAETPAAEPSVEQEDK